MFRVPVLLSGAALAATALTACSSSTLSSQNTSGATSAGREKAAACAAMLTCHRSLGTTAAVSSTSTSSVRVRSSPVFPPPHKQDRAWAPLPTSSRSPSPAVRRRRRTRPSISHPAAISWPCRLKRRPGSAPPWLPRYRWADLSADGPARLGGTDPPPWHGAAQRRAVGDYLGIRSATPKMKRLESSTSGLGARADRPGRIAPTQEDP